MAATCVSQQIPVYPFSGTDRCVPVSKRRTSKTGGKPRTLFSPSRSVAAVTCWFFLFLLFFVFFFCLERLSVSNSWCVLSFFSSSTSAPSPHYRSSTIDLGKTWFTLANRNPSPLYPRFYTEIIPSYDCSVFVSTPSPTPSLPIISIKNAPYFPPPVPFYSGTRSSDRGIISPRPRRCRKNLDRRRSPSSQQCLQRRP